MNLAGSRGPIGEVRVRVPAKVNLALRVGRPRQDGYHELATIYQAVSLYDEVTATASDCGITCKVKGTDAHKCGPEDRNLAFRAAQLLQREYDTTAGVDLLIDKCIPTAAGLAGGSADGAGALLACARLWGLKITGDELLSLGARLGADVPFALTGGCAVGRGRGEVLTPALSRGVFHWVLALAEHGLSTPAVFNRFDELSQESGADIPVIPDIPADLMISLTHGDISRVGALLINDLQAAACSLASSLITTVSVGREAGCLGAIVSGSGSAVAFLVKDSYAATDLAATLTNHSVASQVRIATGPVPGATVI